MTKRKWIWTSVAVVIFVLIALSLRPRPVIVEASRVRRTAMQTAAEGRGETRVRDRFVITSPVAGRIERIEFREGDRAHKGETMIRLLPLPLSETERQQKLAALSESEASLRSALASLKSAETIAANARTELGRITSMHESGVASQQQLDAARKEASTAADAVVAQRGNIVAARSAVDAARGALVALEPERAAIDIKSPADGTVLRIVERSERVVATGETLAVVGDPARIEAVIDLLSEDAIAVRPGAAVTMERWGGDKPLRGRVRTVESGAFMKVSALGIEEQRVHVVVDFIDVDPRLGDAYRVEGRLVTWTTPSTLTVPLSALVRDGADWAVFRVVDGRASLQKVGIGHRNDKEAEILRGVAENDVVIIHPPSAIAGGKRVKVKESNGGE